MRQVVVVPRRVKLGRPPDLGRQSRWPLGLKPIAELAGWMIGGVIAASIDVPNPRCLSPCTVKPAPPD